MLPLKKYKYTYYLLLIYQFLDEIGEIHLLSMINFSLLLLKLLNYSYSYTWLVRTLRQSTYSLNEIHNDLDGGLLVDMNSKYYQSNNW